MFNLLIKKEYRNKFKFTNFLYNELWGLCEKYFEEIDETNDDSTSTVNAMVASYNVVLYCGRTAIDDNTKIDLERFIKNQVKGVDKAGLKKDTVYQVFSPSSDNSILIQMFNVSEYFLRELNAPELYQNFHYLKEKGINIMHKMEAEHFSQKND